MKNKGQKNERTTRLKSMILLVAFTAIMLIVSTYAWFSTQRGVTISNITGEVKVAEGLEISLDANTWSESLDLSTASLTNLTSTDALGTYDTTANRVPGQLKPASTIGAANDTIVKLYSGTFDGTWLDSITKCDETDSSAAAADADYAGYYAFDVFLRNSSESSTAQQLKLSTGSYAKVLSSGNEEMGIQNTVRVAFAEYGATASVNADQDTILDTTVGADTTGEDGEVTRARTIKTSQVAIWEPNANYHVQYMVTYKDRFGGATTARDLDPLTTMAVNDVTTTKKLKVYDSTEDGYKARLTAQSVNATKITVPTTDTDSDGVLDLPSEYATTGDALSLKDTSDAAFSIVGNAVSRLRIYVWLEGQDVDCVNYASHGGGIDVKIGLEK